MKKITTEITLRPRRQITLPHAICEKLGIGPGDKLGLSVVGFSLIITPKNLKALNPLREIQEAFQRSGITEEELLEEGRKIRKELIKERYGIEVPDQGDPGQYGKASRCAELIHVEDAPILAAAIAAKVDYLVSGDKHFLSKADMLKEKGINVVSPAEFWELLQITDVIPKLYELK